MKRLHHDDPPSAGPHITLARLALESDQAVPERRFIGRGADGDRTFLVRLPLPGADPARWAVEAEDARRLPIPGFLPVEEVGGTGDLSWCTTPYVPALPCPAGPRRPAARAHRTGTGRRPRRDAAPHLPAHPPRAQPRSGRGHGVTHAGLSRPSSCSPPRAPHQLLRGRYGPPPPTVSSAAACRAWTPGEFGVRRDSGRSRGWAASQFSHRTSSRGPRLGDPSASVGFPTNAGNRGGRPPV
ncbi:hypothetical protein ACR6C2_25850 [Streptomyces sp. INA 01156]